MEKKAEVKKDLNTKEGDDIKNNVEVDSYIAKLNDDLENQRKKAEEYYESLKRNMADFDNFKKRITKEKDSLYISILADIINEFLPIVDTFEKALEAKCKDEEYKEGTRMIYTQVMELFKKFEVEEISALGEIFDPEFHEAVMSVEDDSKKEKEIVEVFKKGYKMKDKIVRHTLVKVAN